MARWWACAQVSIHYKIWSKFIKPFSSYAQKCHVARRRAPPPSRLNARRRATVQDTMLGQFYELFGFITLVQIPNMSFVTQIVIEKSRKQVFGFAPRDGARRRATTSQPPKGTFPCHTETISWRPHENPTNRFWVMLSTDIQTNKQTNKQTKKSNCRF